MPPVCLMLGGLSSSHRRNRRCGPQACAYFMLHVAAPEQRGTGRKGEDAASHKPCTHNSSVCLWGKTLLSVRGKVSSHAACRVSIGKKNKTKHFGSMGNAVLRAELFMQEDQEHSYEEMPSTLAWDALLLLFCYCLAQNCLHCAATAKLCSKRGLWLGCQVRPGWLRDAPMQ